MSCRRYCSLTTFCTFPLFVDLMKTLLVMFAARGSEARLRFRLFIAIRELIKLVVLCVNVGEFCKCDPKLHRAELVKSKFAEGSSLPGGLTGGLVFMGALGY